MHTCLLLVTMAFPSAWRLETDPQGRVFGRLDFIGEAWRDVIHLTGSVAHSHGGWIGPNLHAPGGEGGRGGVTLRVQIPSPRDDLALMPHLEVYAGGSAHVAVAPAAAPQPLVRLVGPPEQTSTWGWRLPLSHTPETFELRFELSNARLVDVALTSEDYHWARVGPISDRVVNRAIFSANHEPADEQQMRVWHERMHLGWSRPFYEVSRDWKGPRQVDWDAVRKRLEHHREVRTPVVLVHMGGLGHDSEGKAPEDWEAFYADHAWLAEEFARRFPADQWGIKYVEMWNEPDGEFWFKGGWGGDPPHYSAFARAATKGIKTGDPGMRVTLGGIADPAGSSLRSFLWPCLQEFKAAEGADAVALHGYYGDPARCTWDRTILECREICRRLAGRELPVLVTEFNADSHEDFSRWLPFSRQSLYVAETLLHFIRRRVDAAMYFCFGWLGSDFCPYYYDADGKLVERPAVEAFAFYRDYEGRELEVTAPDYLLPVAACEREDAVWIFLVHDGHTPMRVEFDEETAGRAGPRAEAFRFAGEKTEELPPMQLEGRAFTFPYAGVDGKRGVIKLRFPLHEGRD